MATVTIHAGDFPGRSVPLVNGQFFFKRNWFSCEVLSAPRDLAELEVASEETVKRLGGTLLTGAAGALILGPLGLLAGLLAGGNGKRVTFIARFKDGRKLLGSTDAKAYRKLQAALF